MLSVPVKIGEQYAYLLAFVYEIMQSRSKTGE